MYYIIKHSRSILTEADQLLELARGREVISLREIRQAGLSSSSVSRLVRNGKIERLGRGIYRRPDAPVSEHHDLVSIMAKTDKAVVVLLSALRFHELGTQMPRAVWILISSKMRVPHFDTLPIEIVRTRLPALLREGVDIHNLGGISVPITNPARTISDCFKYRNRIGLDVALEALKDLLRRDRNSVNEIIAYAKLNKVFNVMRPYLEASV